MADHYEDLPGGDNNLFSNPNHPANRRGGRKGVFATHPASTPKYSTSNKDVSLETMARLFIPFPGDAERKQFLRRIAAGGDAAALRGAEALATTGKVSAAGAYGVGYIDFLLQKAHEVRNEKMQVVDVLSDNYVSYFFGEAPPTFNYSGTLLNTQQDNWRAAFTSLYSHVLRGTQMARNKTVVVLAYDEVMVTGVFVNMAQMLASEFEMAADLNFGVLVKRYDLSPKYFSSIISPTAVRTFPYTQVPGLFTDRQVATVNATMADAGEIRFTTAARSKPAPSPDNSADLEAAPVDLEQAYRERSIWNSPAVRDLQSVSPEMAEAIADNLGLALEEGGSF